MKLTQEQAVAIIAQYWQECEYMNHSIFPVPHDAGEFHGWNIKCQINGFPDLEFTCTSLDDLNCAARAANMLWRDKYALAGGDPDL